MLPMRKQYTIHLRHVSFFVSLRLEVKGNRISPHKHAIQDILDSSQIISPISRWYTKSQSRRAVLEGTGLFALVFTLGLVFTILVL